MKSSNVSSLPPHPELATGVEIGPWIVRERWDQGSFGVVLRVERAGHPEEGSFALKVAIRPEDPRFEREVALLQRTSHPGIPRLEDQGEWKDSEGWGFPYLVMEWVKGVPLYEWARTNPLTSARVLRLGAQLASALAAAHAAGGLHRDVKGDNVLVTASECPVLLDWGCGTYRGARKLTDTCLPPGTFSYRTPEAHRWSWAHRKTDKLYGASPADDVYALGVTLYRLSTGTYPPAPTENSGPQRPLLPPRELSTVSVGLERLLLLCLSEDRRARPTAATLAIEFSAAAEEEDAGEPIVPTSTAASKDSKSSTGSEENSEEESEKGLDEWEWPAWASMALVALGGGLTAGLLVLLAARCVVRWSENPPLTMAELRSEPLRETPDGGVGEQALTSVEDVPKAVIPALFSLGRPMPPKGFPGQRRPPCMRGEREIHGACWLGPMEGQEPPCGDRMFDYEGKCYFASYDQGQQPTSEDPR